ncbi:hypothetical protein Pvag_pPag20070 (plasmid) [Pantoea vagans C9-1]|nr:hypothetical protein Pvag_pPag20070 [Pantoea vagans C9-1]
MSFISPGQRRQWRSVTRKLSPQLLLQKRMFSMNIMTNPDDGK